MRHFLTLKDFTKEEILEIIKLAFKIKKKNKKYLKGQTLGMVFEKSSTRTRVSFEVGMFQLGGHALFLSSDNTQLGRGEPIKDTARVFSRMLDMITVRTFSQERLEEFAQYSTIPVINALTDTYHPVQLIADYMTMVEHKKDKNPVVAYVGDGNNMAHSWLMLASKLGFELRVASPVGYECDGHEIDTAMKQAKISGAKIRFFHDPKEAVKGADVVTTDTWISMGQEEGKAKKVEDFEGFIVDADLMKLAKKDAIFLHCLPAYRGYEVSEEVLEQHEKVVFDEAENRLHGQKGIMVWLDKQRK
ncbi:MAG TPA: ornithine carbamoyltransferase [Campylobacterales bacterium]|nr:ornithine carbamoyltransferase [Campylobacterales bacterium]